MPRCSAGVDLVRPLPLKTFRVRNFKAIHDSGTLRFGPLTVLIGANGSGKSSVIEALETVVGIAQWGPDEALQMWKGFEQVWHQGVPHVLRSRKGERPYAANAMSFEFTAHFAEAPAELFRALIELSLSEDGNRLLVTRERCGINGRAMFTRNSDGQAEAPGVRYGARLEDGETVLQRQWGTLLRDWQFLAMSPERMGEPVPERRTGRPGRLTKDGSNVAEYLQGIREKDLAAFEGIIEALRCVVPYARDLQPALASELQRTVYLQMTEGTFKVPGWLLSTGTLRILALLAVLRHPTPPPLLVIEEIENGLDPATIHLLIEEIRAAVESGRTQVIATTHSPYLLDLLSLEHLVVVERVEGRPVFRRPADDASLREWSQRFAPGKLYTTGRLAGNAAA